MLRPMLFLLLSLLLLLSGCKVEMYSGLSEDQANQMLSTLLRRGIEAEKQAAGKNGYTLLVDDDQLVRALQVLKENSLPREAFKNLGEVFAGDGMISSTSEVQARMSYALSQELADTLSRYNAETGHRVKEPQAFVSWAHSELKLQDFHLKQCLYGEHLLKNSSSPVMLVESEKTAVVMSHFIPDYIWLATGGKNGCFNSEAMQVLKGREVTLIPDLGATEQWKEKSALLSGICKRVVVSNVLECTSDEEQRSQGLDIADFFLYSPSKRQILHQMIQRNPALQLLIDELDLELIE